VGADLLDAATSEPIVWLRRGQGFVALGEAARCDTCGPDRFDAAERWWRAILAAARIDGPSTVPGMGPLAFGTFAFAATSLTESTLIVPRLVVARYRGEEWTTEAMPDADHSSKQPAAASRTRRHEADGHTQPLGPGSGRGNPNSPGGSRGLGGPAPMRSAPLPPLIELPGPISADAWPGVVARGIAQIEAGKMDKVVLARSVVAESTGGPIDTRSVLARLAQYYADTWTFAVDGMIGATPEILLRSSRGLATSRVLAGTIRRGGADEADLAHAAALARSSKDLEEHEFAVQSVVAALEPFVEELSVPEIPSVLHLPNVMHLATEVVGELRRSRSGGWPGALRLVAALHPSAAVCGTPRQAAAAAIEQLEGLDRGRYAGPVGWIDQNGAGEWGLALRSAQLSPDRRSGRLWAGGGIVAASDPAAELAETEAKLQPMRYALGLLDNSGTPPGPD
jgi:menaquinone-specific isochorismate synthase